MKYVGAVGAPVAALAATGAMVVYFGDGAAVELDSGAELGESVGDWQYYEHPGRSGAVSEVSYVLPSDDAATGIRVFSVLCDPTSGRLGAMTIHDTIRAEEFEVDPRYSFGVGEPTDVMPGPRRSTGALGGISRGTT